MVVKLFKGQNYNHEFVSLALAQETFFFSLVYRQYMYHECIYTHIPLLGNTLFKVL